MTKKPSLNPAARNFTGAPAGRYMNRKSSVQEGTPDQFGDPPAMSGLASRFSSMEAAEPVNRPGQKDVPQLTPSTPKSLQRDKPYDHTQLIREMGVSPSAHPVNHVNRTSDVPSGYHRITPPSRCIPYSFNNIYARPLNVGEIAGIYAAHSSASYSDLLDALAPAMHQDIRDLTVADFRFMMYWWRLNSFKKGVFTVTYRSRYGNENTIKIKNSDLSFIELDMTKDEYAKYLEMGIAIPTVRDAESMIVSDMDDRTSFLASYAQFIATPHGTTQSLEQKIEVVKTLSADIMDTIKVFTEKTEHGVTEKIKIADEKFEPKQTVERFREWANMVEGYLQANASSMSEDDVLARRNDVISWREEADEIEAKLAEGAPVQAREEVLVLNIDTMDFFSQV